MIQLQWNEKTDVHFPTLNRSNVTIYEKDEHAPTSYEKTNKGVHFYPLTTRVYINDKHRRTAKLTARYVKGHYVII